MRKIISVFALVAVLMLLAGCGQQAQTQKTVATASPENQAVATTVPAPQAQVTKDTSSQNSNEAALKMSKLYRYGMLSQFEYKITSSAGGQQSELNLKYRISSDSLNGKEAWLQESDMSVQGNTATTKIWLDKSNLGCLKINTVMNYAGQTFAQDGQCPTEGPNSAAKSAVEPDLTYVGKESVTVPAGTFNAKKYESNGATFWVDDNVPLPLKVSYGVGSTVMELVSYK